MRAHVKLKEKHELSAIEGRNKQDVCVIIEKKRKWRDIPLRAYSSS